MSDGGFNVDEHIKKRRGVTKIHSTIFNKKGQYHISYPDMVEGNNVEYVKRPGEFTEPENIEPNVDIVDNIQEEVSKNEIKPIPKPKKPKMRLSVSAGETKRIGNIELTKTNNDFEVKFVKFDRILIDRFKNLVPKRIWQNTIRKWKVPFESEQQLLEFFRKYFYDDF